jgi:putative tryptophan/tyrosine transport system substrate-binding protein
MRCSKIGHIVLLLSLLLPGPASARAEGWVAVLLSDAEPVYEKPLQTFRAAMTMEVRDFNLQGDIRHDPGLKSRIFKNPPALIFALGAKAAFTAKLWTEEHQDIPVLFAMVLNWQKYRLLDGRNNIAGISYEVNPGNQFLSLSLFAPQIHRIGVIYSGEYSSELVADAKKATEMLGLELIERPISSDRYFQRTYKELCQKADGIWVLNDPVTYTLDNMAWLQQRCIQDHLVCIGQSINLTQIGILLSVRADTANIGTQAASMVVNILEKNQPPSAIGVMEPLGTAISLNRRTAKRIGLALNRQALNMATEVIE